MFRNADLYVSASKLGGRGVFAAESIQKDEMIESCPVILCKKGEREPLDATALYDYYFLWDDEENPDIEAAIALGWGSLYNHNAPSNARYVMDFEEQTIDIFARRYIEAGEEITINYNGDPTDTTPPWFMTDGKNR
jgi:uncharacterized protein